jgi:hypothetical protein
MGRNYAETTNNQFNSVKSSHPLFHCEATKVRFQFMFRPQKHFLNIQDFRNNQKICIVRPRNKRICWLVAILIWQGNIQTIQNYYIYIGCYKGWRGSDCSKPCPATCVDGHCYPGNGTCVWGCAIGQDGDNCDRRNVYIFLRSLCTRFCCYFFLFANCLNDICDTATGKCTQGC